MDNMNVNGSKIDSETNKLLNLLFKDTKVKRNAAEKDKNKIIGLLKNSEENRRTTPIVDLFRELLDLKKNKGASPNDFGVDRQKLIMLAIKHQEIDEHYVTVGGRVGKALNIVKQANERVKDYLADKKEAAPSGIELWDRIQQNTARIKGIMGISDEEWNSYSGQLRYAIEDVDTLSKVIALPKKAIEDVTRVTRNYRMRLTPYYASLIMPGKLNDPILQQSVPTGEMVDNVGVEIPPVAADHSPARLIDQFYPQVAAMKVTNICAMYCTHCLRIAHIGKMDNIYSKEAYEDALNYIRSNPNIRDVLITGGDAFVLPNEYVKWILNELDSIDHVKMKRLGTRIPITTPQRIDSELLDILAESNDKKPLRVVVQINTAQEITPVSKEAFKMISKRVSAILNQAVLLKGINDTKYKMWRLCETMQEAYVRPYYLFNCSFRNPQFSHLRVPVEVGRDIVESMYGNISGDAIPRYIAAAGGKIPLHKSNVARKENGNIILRKPWSGDEVSYPDADPKIYNEDRFSFRRFKE